jgi:hypothetical protein
MMELYKCAVNRILEMNKEGLRCTDIEKNILAEFKIGTKECKKVNRSTFYTIWRILKELNFVVKD